MIQKGILIFFFKIDTKPSRQGKCETDFIWNNLRAIPFEKLVDVGFSNHPTTIFHIFLWYPEVIFSPLTQCKKQPVRPPHGIYKNTHQTRSPPPPFQME